MNCSFDSTASYSDLFRVTGRFLTAYVRKLKDEENEPSNYVQRPLWFPFRFTWDEYLLWFLFVWFWKFARQIYIRHVGQWYCHRFRIEANSVRRVQENLWSLAVDTFLWLFVAQLVQGSAQSCNLFVTPSSMFKELKATNQVPTAAKVFYMLNLGKYVFNIYAVLKLDERRKDFSVMLMHHLVTIVLLSISYVARAWRTGILVIFVHDIVDIFMISAKILIYSKPRLRPASFLHTLLINVLAGCFVISWVVNRLYLYPLRAIYYAGEFPMHSKDARIMGIAFLLLFAIFLMDIYWTYYIFKFIWRVLAEDQVIYDPMTDARSFVKHRNSNQNKPNSSDESSKDKQS